MKLGFLRFIVFSIIILLEVFILLNWSDFIKKMLHFTDINSKNIHICW